MDAIRRNFVEKAVVSCEYKCPFTVKWSLTLLDQCSKILNGRVVKYDGERSGHKNRYLVLTRSLSSLYTDVYNFYTEVASVYSTTRSVEIDLFNMSARSYFTRVQVPPSRHRNNTQPDTLSESPFNSSLES